MGALLEQVHREYLDVGQNHGLAMFALTDTWRANHERIDRSRYKGVPIQSRQCAFLRRYGTATARWPSRSLWAATLALREIL